ncbi:MAG: phosphoglucosamine mutase, partial [Myxococcales bacterium]|nr:phosphoglucosamine mutase [Myxococcales bacterium]
ATVMSNLGLDKAVRAAGGRVERVGVGDRYVVERMREGGYSLGGEQSGHVILHDFATTGDGLVTALAVLGIARREGATLSELAACMERFPQVLLNVPVARKPPLETLSATQRAIAEVEASLDGDGRVLVRYSGTQNLARVMVEGPTQALIDDAAGRIAAVLEEELG